MRLAYDEERRLTSSVDSGQRLAIPYREFDVWVTDFNEEELVQIGKTGEVEHLSAGSFSSPAFPVNGFIYGLNLRFMVPLVCQGAENSSSQAINVWFLVDMGSPFTCLTVKSLEAIFGAGHATHRLYRLAIQDQNSKIICQVSKAHFQEVNILGADAMLDLGFSIKVVGRIDFQLTKL